MSKTMGEQKEATAENPAGRPSRSGLEEVGCTNDF
jgi:hypothetical protein